MDPPEESLVVAASAVTGGVDDTSGGDVLLPGVGGDNGDNGDGNGDRVGKAINARNTAGDSRAQPCSQRRWRRNRESNSCLTGALKKFGIGESFEVIRSHFLRCRPRTPKGNRAMPQPELLGRRLALHGRLVQHGQHIQAERVERLLQSPGKRRLMLHRLPKLLDGNAQLLAGPRWAGSLQHPLNQGGLQVFRQWVFVRQPARLRSTRSFGCWSVTR